MANEDEPPCLRIIYILWDKDRDLDNLHGLATLGHAG